jgi:hypothetical protein
VLAALVYALCALTAGSCAWLLLRAHRRSGARLLLWGGCCFAGLALNNGLVFVDLVVLPGVDLQTPRHLVAVAAVAVLVFGLVWDAE